MFGILIAISAASMAPSSSATENDHPIKFEGDTAHIAYGDLDIASRQGRSQLAGRIRKAAERICANYDGGELSSAQISECNRVLTASGIEQIQNIMFAKPNYKSQPRAIPANAMAQAPDERGARQ